MDRMMKSYDGWIGRYAYDRSGEKVGKIALIYYDDHTGRPEWVGVATGLFGRKVTFAPIAGSSLHEDDLQLAHDKDTINDAPNCEVGGDLGEAEERRLFSHYQFDWDRTARSGYGDQTRADSVFDRGDGRVGTRTESSGGDDAMTRSEEELRVHKERRATGKVRLRKYVVTEYRQVTVPVTREEVRVEREPITDANVGDAMSGPEITDSEHEVVTHEERPVVSTETVPKERVRLEKDTVTDQETVSGDVRKERINVESTGDRPTQASDPATDWDDSALDGLTRDELYARARQLGIPGRSKMSKAHLRRAVAHPDTGAS
jgi:uncharacterized protein (TIGR02271 family)